MLNYLFLHILRQLSNIYLSALDLNSHRIFNDIRSPIRGGGLSNLLIGLDIRILKSISIGGLLECRLLTLVPYLARVEVARLGPERHQHVSIQHFPFLRLCILLLPTLLFNLVIFLRQLGVQLGADPWKLEVG